MSLKEMRKEVRRKHELFLKRESLIRRALEQQEKRNCIPESRLRLYIDVVRSILGNEAKKDGIPPIAIFYIKDILWAGDNIWAPEMRNYTYAQFHMREDLVEVARCVPGYTPYFEGQLVRSLFHEYGHHRQLWREFKGDKGAYLEAYMNDPWEYEAKSDEVSNELEKKYYASLAERIPELKSWG